MITFTRGRRPRSVLVSDLTCQAHMKKFIQITGMKCSYGKVFIPVDETSVVETEKPTSKVYSYKPKSLLDAKHKLCLNAKHKIKCSVNQALHGFGNGFSDPNIFREFRETGPWPAFPHEHMEMITKEIGVRRDIGNWDHRKRGPKPVCTGLLFAS